LLINTQLTRDLDDGRSNDYPSIVVGPTGQRIAFYKKFLTTGKISFSRITFVSPSFTVDVEAGNGSVQGTSVTWSAGTLTATANTYEIVYVDTSGILHISPNLSMTDAQNVILLAYVQTGSTSITRIEEIEHTGSYIYIRRQMLVGSSWVWNDYEYRLNTGEEPRAYYDLVNNKIYLSYKKDGVSYVRMFDPTNELTWEYLPNVNISSNTLTLNNDPSNSIVLALSGGYKTSSNLVSDEYPMGDTQFLFMNNNPYIILPYITGDNLLYAYGPVTYEIMTYSLGVYTVEASFILPNVKYTSNDLRVVPWPYTLGLKYIRCSLSTRLFSDMFVTNPVNYKQLNLFSYPINLTLSDDAYNADVKDNTRKDALSSGYKVDFTKTAEYEETKSFPSDTTTGQVLSSGYKVLVLITNI